MKFVRIVPLFNLKREVVSFIPHLKGFMIGEELAVLEKLNPTIPHKTWAFVEDIIPEGYQGVLVTQKSPRERISTLRIAEKEIIGYNLTLEMGIKELLEICSAVAIDISYSGFENLLPMVDIFSTGAKKIALDVSNDERFEMAQRYGFDYVEGDFYTKAISERTSNRSIHINPVRASKVMLMGEIVKWGTEGEHFDVERVTRIISGDIYLTINLIRVANSPLMGGGRKIASVRDAIVQIGFRNLRQWVIALLADAITDEKTPEVARAALVKSRFMENIAPRFKLDRGMAFLTGIASVSGVMLGTSTEEAIAELKIPPVVNEYAHRTGEYGWLLGLAETYLRGEFGGAELYMAALRGEKGITARQEIYEDYIDAELWVREMQMLQVHAG